MFKLISYIKTLNDSEFLRIHVHLEPVNVVLIGQCS